MNFYIGCDVSLRTISVCVMDAAGKIHLRKDVAASPDTLFALLGPYRNACLVGLEAGSTTNWLVRALRNFGVHTLCLEAHHTRKVLSAQPVKTDRNDAEGLAQLLRTGWYKETHVTQEDTQELKSYLEARQTVKNKQQDIKNAIRGLVKPFGVILPKGSGSLWPGAVRERLLHERFGLWDVIDPLLTAYESLCDAVSRYDAFIRKYARNDEVCARLQTIDGIGPINAFAFKTVIDTPDRFSSNRDVGAYLGLTPRIYASGESERRGGITRAGSSMMRSLLFEAAQSLLSRTKRLSSLKSWAMRLCKKKPTKLVVAALARKLGVLMLAIWKNGTTFNPKRTTVAANMAQAV
ncbi:IS110 family transposase [Pelagibius sp. Alg239-R121]|uniref:IS110 family transposase n=1 Tax=Pelagibius sp. Alg239-R121 TaxID=2993448 RepID=UPI0024A6AF67|nr:IS110 family transposase [Pelagibius sp. Alg239-R121]